MRNFWTLAAAAATALSVVQAKENQGPQRLNKRYSGTATFYNTETGNQGACGGFLKNSDYIVALNSAQYDQGGWCGVTIRISANGQTRNAVVVDRCPGCGGVGGVDMSPGLFSQTFNYMAATSTTSHDVYFSLDSSSNLDPPYDHLDTS